MKEQMNISRSIHSRLATQKDDQWGEKSKRRPTEWRTLWNLTVKDFTYKDAFGAWTQRE